MIRIEPWSGPGDRWDEFVTAAGDGTIMHLYGWREVIERAYGHSTFYLAVRERDALRGVLPLVLVRSPLLRPALVSMPFMDYGGACANGSEDVERALVGAAIEIARDEGAQLVLRMLRDPELPLSCSRRKVTMLLDLGKDEEELWKRLPSERRNRIRKAQKSGLAASLHGLDGLSDFYQVFSRNMRDLGSPVHGRSFFQEVLARLPDHARILLVRKEGEPVGAGLLLPFRDMISIPWVSSIRDFFRLCPNQLLYWEAMRFGIARGFRILDFGRSSRDSGTFETKRQWGARPVQLHWYYYPERAVPPGEDVEKLSWATALWQRLPLGLANRIGPWLRGGIPN